MLGGVREAHFGRHWAGSTAVTAYCAIKRGLATPAKVVLSNILHDGDFEVITRLKALHRVRIRSAHCKLREVRACDCL